jgi:hypothetical protein
MRRKTAIDLFSGIGGFSLGLQHYFRTVAYCENNPNAIAVLKDNMRRKNIDKGSVYEDVRLLDKSIMDKHKPFAVTMGFPCQDISVLKRNPNGVRGKRSGLVLDVIHLLGKCPYVKVLFMENSPAIRIRGLKQLENCLQKAGFTLSWTLLSAAECGASHRRNRWWGMAYRSIEDVQELEKLLPTNQPRPWAKEVNPRVVPRANDQTAHSAHITRHSLLGNSIVPRCAGMALQALIHKALGMEPPANAFGYVTLPKLHLMYPTGVIEKTGWATPVFSKTSAITQCKQYSARCSKLLTNQVMYDKGTYHGMVVRVPFNMRLKYYQVNPEWIEWLMGYPKKWTQIIDKVGTQH